MIREQLPSVSILLTALETDSKKYLISHLLSITKLNYPKNKIEIIIRDNGIGKLSRNQVQKSFPRVKIIGQGSNVNFAKGINEAARKAKGKWLFITNPDTLLDPKCLFNIVVEVQKQPNLAIAAPLVYSLKNKKRISTIDLPVSNLNKSSGNISNVMPQMLRKLNYPQEVNWVSGCAMLVRRDIWNELKGFDEKYVVYWEDADFGMRVKKLGFKVIIVPSAIVWHAGSVVYGKESPQKIYLIIRNKLIFLNKNLNVLGKLLMHTKNGVVISVKILKILLGIESAESKAFIRGIISFYLHK